MDLVVSISKFGYQLFYQPYLLASLSFHKVPIILFNSSGCHKELKKLTHGRDLIWGAITGQALNNWPPWLLLSKITWRHTEEGHLFSPLESRARSS